MSSHGYRTTTVEYYEYLMPNTCEYNYESGRWPLETTVSDCYVTRPHSSINYLTNLHLAMAGDNNQHSEFIYDMGQNRQRQTIIEISEQDESEITPPPSNTRYQNHNARDSVKESEYETGNGIGDATPAEPQSNKKKHGRRNIYQAKQGYLVEEPTSESEEDQESTT